MGKTAIAVSVVLGISIVFGWQIGRADLLTPMEVFYRDSLQQMIVRCHSKTKLLDTEGQNLQKEGGRALLQLYFYETHKEEIIYNLALQKAARSRAKVDYLLIRAFTDFNRTVISDNR